MTVAANDPGLEDTLSDLTRWFFDDYLSRIQETGTTAPSLDEIWPIHPGNRLRATERLPS